MDELRMSSANYEIGVRSGLEIELGGLSSTLVEAAVSRGGGRRPCAPLECPSCRGVPINPVTPPCGHTACRACLSRGECPRCRRHFSGAHHLRDNVLVKAAVHKWWPYSVEAANLREEVNIFILNNYLELALDKLNQALLIVADHLLLEARSEVLFKLNKWEASLCDADHLTKLKPLWPKGYYRRGMALANLGQYEDALISFLLCVSLDKCYVPVIKPEVAKTLQRMSNSTMSCKSLMLMRAPLTPWGLPNYMEEDSMDVDHIYETFNGSQRQPFQSLENRKLHMLLERITHEIDKLKRVDQEPGELELRPEVVDASDFECVLCCRTLWRPVTTPCGHTYCSMCLERCLDYSPNCPLCMAPLHEYLSTSEKSVTEFIESAMLMALPREYTTRLQAHRLEVNSFLNTPDIPVFVCTIAFPTIPCPLLVFEPKYRLMVRRAIDSGTRRFGMAACLKQPNGMKRYADYGTILEIKDWLLMNDGRSILSNIGIKRFRVISRGERDGYDTAQVQYISDIPIPQSSLPEVTLLHDRVLERGRRWFSRMPHQQKALILKNFGEMPNPEPNWNLLEDGPAWCWWLLAILPLSVYLQISILGTTCLEKRLRAIDKTLKHLDQGVLPVKEMTGSCQAILRQPAIRLT